MPCSECPGEGTCIRAADALGAYPDNKFSGDDHLFREAIAAATCPEGNVPKTKARRATLDHAMREVHKGGGYGRLRLPEAVGRAVLRRKNVHNESIFENLRDKAFSQIIAALDFFPDSSNLYDFEYGVAFFPFIFSYLFRDVGAMLSKEHDSIDDLPPLTNDQVDAAQDQFLERVDRSQNDALWNALVALEPKLLQFEKRLLDRLERVIMACDLTPKKLMCLKRAITIIRRGLEDDPGHSVKLYGGSTPECDEALLLATIVSNDTGRMLYNHKNGAVLTAGLPNWLDECFALLIKSVDPAELRTIAALTKVILDIRENKKVVLERIGQRKSGLDDPDFSLDQWNGPARIETKGRVVNGGIANSGHGIAGYGGLFGCVPRSSPALQRLFAAASTVIDLGGA